MSRAFLVLGLLLTVAPPGPAIGQEGSPAGPVPVDRLRARREALLRRIGNGIALIRNPSERSDDPPDSDYPQDNGFRPDPDFFYLTGLEEPDAWLALVARDSSPGQVLLFLPPRNPHQEQWLGKRLGAGAEAAALTGIAEQNVRSTDRAEREIRRLFTEPTGQAAGRPPLWIKRTRGNAQDSLLRSLVSETRARTEDLSKALAFLRQVKDQDEIRRLRRAAEISAEGHLAAMREAKPGAWEYQLEAAAEGTFHRLGAERVGYPSIVGSGINGTVLHYDLNRRQMEAGELVVMDMAAEFGYYSADVTRTIPVSGSFSERQRALYDLVLGSQQAAMDSVRPGTTLGRLDQIAREYLRARSGTLCGDSPCDRYFIHGCCHHIGLDVHDPAASAALRPGMVFTVEPGIYLVDEKLGIRIEDDVLVTETGYELLSGGVPRKAEEVERAMSRGER